MTNSLEQVRPGDLITADFMNRFIEKLESLEGRVATLENASASTNAPVITALFPSGALKIGQEFQILGQNFAVPANLNIVSIDGVLIERFQPGSTDGRLILHVPPIVGAPKTVTLTVRTQAGVASKTFTVLSEDKIPEGTMVITDETGDLGVINEGNTYTYKFKLDSQTTIGETYQLTPLFSDAVGDASTSDWSTNARLVDQGGATLGSDLITIEPGNPVHIGVAITIPTGAESVYFALRAISLHNSAELTTTSGSISIVVGSEQETSDPRVTFVLGDFGPFSVARKATIDGVEGIEMPYGQTDTLPFQAQFQDTIEEGSVAGTFDYEAFVELDAGETYWELNTSTLPTESSETDGTSEILGLGLTLKMTAPPSDPTQHPEKRYLVIKAVRQGSSSFESWRRTPIQGFTP